MTGFLCRALVLATCAEGGPLGSDGSPFLRGHCDHGQSNREEDDHQLVRILKLVIPANAGIHLGLVHMDSRLRGNDERASKPGFRMDTR